jgi:hypothetical protein
VRVIVTFAVRGCGRGAAILVVQIWREYTWGAGFAGGVGLTPEWFQYNAGFGSHAEFGMLPAEMQIPHLFGMTKDRE